MPRGGRRPRTAVDRGHSVQERPPQPNPYLLREGLPSPVRNPQPHQFRNRRTWTHLRNPQKATASNNECISYTANESPVRPILPLPSRSSLPVTRQQMLASLPAPSPNYVPRQRPQEVTRSAMVDSSRQTEEDTADVDLSIESIKPTMVSQSLHADSIAATNVLLGVRFAVLAGTFNVPDLQLVATYLQVSGGGREQLTDARFTELSSKWLARRKAPIPRRSTLSFLPWLRRILIAHQPLSVYWRKRTANGFRFQP